MFALAAAFETLVTSAGKTPGRSLSTGISASPGVIGIYQLHPGQTGAPPGLPAVGTIRDNSSLGGQAARRWPARYEDTWRMTYKSVAETWLAAGWGAAVSISSFAAGT